MAPLPPNGTPRFRVNYSVNGIGHDFQVRSASSPSAIGDYVGAFLGALEDSIYELIVSTVEFAADNSNVFLPVTTGVEGQTFGSGENVVLQAPQFYGFIGRTSGGRKWHLDVFGAGLMFANFRVEPGEDARLTAAVTALGDPSGSLIGIDGLPVTVYTYVNAGINSYWQRAIRNG